MWQGTVRGGGGDLGGELGVQRLRWSETECTGEETVVGWLIDWLTGWLQPRQRQFVDIVVFLEQKEEREERKKEKKQYQRL